MAGLTIFHNPNCGTSRKVLNQLREAGRKPEVVEYLKVGWTKPQLKDLLAKMGARPRKVLRMRGTPAEELGLGDAAVSDDAILEAMTLHPILVERPIVVLGGKAALCRPADLVREFL